MKNFLSLNDLTDTEILTLVKEAIAYKNGLKIIPDLSKITIANLFFEPSTRTNASFYQAELQTKMNILNIDMNNLSTKKGETLQDTIQIFASLNLDGLIIRHNKEFYYKELLNHFFLKFINAGDGKNEHPSQTLLDLVTIYENFQTFKQLKVLIIGDIKHSRVAHSNIQMFKRLGMEVYLSSPPEFIDEKFPKEMYVQVDEVIQDMDVVMLLRVQHERHDQIMKQVDYLTHYGMNAKRYEVLKEHSIILHPGPYNREVEIASEIIYKPKSKIWEQVTNGLYARIAILNYTFGGEK